MTVNHKLTNLVKDRVLQSFQLNASELLITFLDGWTKTVESRNATAHHFTRVPESDRSLRIRQSFCSSVKTTARST